MSTATRRRTTWAIAASLIAHAVVLTIAAVQSPTLYRAARDGGPARGDHSDPAPAPHPAAGPGAQAPSPIRLHQRAPRFAAAEPPIAPLPAPPPTATPAPPTPPGPVTVTPNPAAEIERGEVRAALQGLVGCRNPDAAGLTAAQRAKCDERLAAGAEDAPSLGLGVSGDKRRPGSMRLAARKRHADAQRIAAPAADHPSSPARGSALRQRPPGGQDVAVLKTKRPGIAPGPLGTLTLERA